MFAQIFFLNSIAAEKNYSCILWQSAVQCLHAAAAAVDSMKVYPPPQLA